MHAVFMCVPAVQSVQKDTEEFIKGGERSRLDLNKEDQQQSERGRERERERERERKKVSLSMKMTAQTWKRENAPRQQLAISSHFIPHSHKCLRSYLLLSYFVLVKRGGGCETLTTGWLPGVTKDLPPLPQRSEHIEHFAAVCMQFKLT